MVREKGIFQMLAGCQRELRRRRVGFERERLLFCRLAQLLIAALAWVEP
jgi:hypothetical protein